MIPYLIEGDEVFGSGRLCWWMRVDFEGKLPEEPIPQITFRNAHCTEVADRYYLRDLSDHLVARKAGDDRRSHALSAYGALSHVRDLLGRMGGGWSALTYLVRWIAWGLGVGHNKDAAPAEPEAGWEEVLYKYFELGRLQAADCDLFGGVIVDNLGHGRWGNANAFYPTPQEVCKTMALMTMNDGQVREGDQRLASVCDPCVGTGRMLLEASNYSVHLYGCDIDGLMVDCTAVNMALFAPWGVYRTPRQAQVLKEVPPRTEDVVAEAARIRERSGFSAVKNPAVFDQHGQGMLFSFPEGNDAE
jgi:hypothetical protein